MIPMWLSPYFISLGKLSTICSWPRRGCEHPRPWTPALPPQTPGLHDGEWVGRNSVGSGKSAHTFRYPVRTHLYNKLDQRWRQHRPFVSCDLRSAPRRHPHADDHHAACLTRSAMETSAGAGGYTAIVTMLAETSPMYAVAFLLYLGPLTANSSVVSLLPCLRPGPGSHCFCFSVTHRRFNTLSSNHAD